MLSNYTINFKYCFNFLFFVRIIAKRGKLDKLPNVICYEKINQSREKNEVIDLKNQVINFFSRDKMARKFRYHYQNNGVVKNGSTFKTKSMTKGYYNL